MARVGAEQTGKCCRAVVSEPPLPALPTFSPAVTLLSLRREVVRGLGA